jgi:hypothetical protein
MDPPYKNPFGGIRNLSICYLSKKIPFSRIKNPPVCYLSKEIPFWGITNPPVCYLSKEIPFSRIKNRATTTFVTVIAFYAMKSSAKWYPYGGMPCKKEISLEVYYFYRKIPKKMLYKKNFLLAFEA